MLRTSTFILANVLLVLGCGESEEAKRKQQEEDARVAAFIAEEKARADAIIAEDERKRAESAAKFIAKIEKREDFTVPVEGMNYFDKKLKMIWVEPGSFIFGLDKEHAKTFKPVKVTLTQGFYLGMYEITLKQYRLIHPRGTVIPEQWWDIPRWIKQKGKLFDFNLPKFYWDRPVDRAEWEDAAEFCEVLTANEKAAGRLPEGMAYKLPTEAQWEYACRAGTSTMYWWGNEEDKVLAGHTFKKYRHSPSAKIKATWSETEHESVEIGFQKVMFIKTAKVGRYPANPWGFRDMDGNVNEWVDDWWAELPEEDVTDPIGPTKKSRGRSPIKEERLKVLRFQSNIRSGVWNLKGRSYLGFRISLQSGSNVTDLEREIENGPKAK